MNILKLALLVVLSAPLTGIGQTIIEEVYQGSDHVAFKEVFLNVDGNWIFSGSANPDGSVGAGMYFLHSVNDFGIGNWHHSHPVATDNQTYLYSAAPDVGQVKSTQLGDILITGYDEQCDYYVEETYLIKLDSVGIPKWTQRFPSTDNFSYLNIADNINDKIAIASSDSVLVLEMDSIVSGHWQSPVTPIHYLQWESDSTILATAGAKLVRFHQNGALVDSASISSTDHGIDIRIQGGNIWVLTYTHIEVFSQEFEPITEIDLSSFSGSRFDFVDVQGNTWFTDGNFLVSIDQQYNLSPVLEFDFPNSSVAVNDSLVMTAATVSQNDKYSGMMKSYFLNGTTVSNNEDDVELLVTIDSTRTGFSGNYITGYTYCTVKIVNNSVNTLEEVLVSSPTFPPYAICGEPAISVAIENMELSQGDTFSFQFPPVLIYTTSGVTSPDSIQRPFCLTAQSPNNHLDNNPTDNVACATATVILEVEEQNQLSHISVYPNPTTGIINLPQIENLKWQLFDATGRKVSEGNEQLQIDLRTLDLPESVYLLQLNTEQGRATVKLVYQTQ